MHLNFLTKSRVLDKRNQGRVAKKYLENMLKMKALKIEQQIVQEKEKMKRNKCNESSA